MRCKREVCEVCDKEDERQREMKYQGKEMILDDRINEVVVIAEEAVTNAFNAKFVGAPKPPPIDTFKASMMAEIARRLKARAIKIEEDWAHFTRE